MKLYDLERSGNCYKARLMLALLGIAFEKVQVNLAAGDQKQPEYLALNPLGQVPLLDDDGVLVRDSAAILVYLGSKHGSGTWYPADAAGQAHIQQWLALVASDIYQGIVGARAIKLGIRQGDHAAAVALGTRALAVIETQLKSTPWLTGNRPTIADIAVYSYVGMAPVGGIDLASFGSITGWCRRIEQLPGYVALPQVAASK